MESKKGLSFPEKIGAAICALLLVGAACLIGFRVVHKPAYEARERLQCDLLAHSAALALAAALRAEPETLAQFATPTTLFLDHREMPDNWNLSFTTHVMPGRTLLRIEAASGWNARSPKRRELHVALYTDGTLADAETGVRMQADDGGATNVTDTGRTLSFLLLDGKEPRVPLRVRLFEAQTAEGGDPYFLLRPAL